MGNKTVKLAFDPYESELTRAVFRDEIARVLWLLWRPTHMVSDRFNAACLDIASTIRRKSPKTADDLRLCICPCWGAYQDFTPGDAAKFVETALPFFLGIESVDFEVHIPANS